MSGNHINSACLEKVSSMFKTGSSLKCRNALDFDFTALTHFSVALYMYTLVIYVALDVVSFGLQEVIGKIISY